MENKEIPESQESQEARDPPDQPDPTAHPVHPERTELLDVKDKLEELDFQEREDQWVSVEKMVSTEQWEAMEIPELLESPVSPDPRVLRDDEESTERMLLVELTEPSDPLDHVVPPEDQERTAPSDQKV